MSPRRRLGAALVLCLAAHTACDAKAPSRYAQFDLKDPDLLADEDDARDGRAAVSWPTLDETFLAASAATLRFRLGRPVPLAIAPDGAVLFRRTAARERVADLYQLPAAADGAAVLATTATLLAGGDEQLSAEEKARRERSRTTTRGIVDVSLSDDGKVILVPVGERLFVVDRASGAARALRTGAGYPIDPQLSPDGSKVAFDRDGDVWVAPLSGGKATQVTRHPPGPGIEYGVAEFVAQEELDRSRGTWWSPDGKQLLFQRTDASAVETVYVADARHPAQPPVPFKYPRPGQANAKVDLGLVSAAGGTPRWVTWDLARYPYLAQVYWPKRGPLTLIVLNREQTDLAALVVDPATGATRVLLTEHDDAWVNAPPDLLTWLDDGSGFLWRTEAPGSWALDHYDADGKLVGHVILPALGLRTVCGVTPDGSAVIVEASADPREQHVWRVPLGGGDPVPLTELADGGVHSAVTKHGVVIIESQLRHGGHQVMVVRADQRRVELPSVAERPPLVPTTQFYNFSVDGHMQYGAITRPRAFDKSRKYPVLLSVYGGPHVKTVVDALDTYLMDQWYADAGFIVVRTDGRGTPDRGRDYERAIAGDLLSLPMNDQMGALRRLGRKHPELDLARVGVFGWSFGGYMATMATLLHPETFAAGIAGAPVTDWELYDTAYTERYMKLPAQNPEGYRRTSALTYADKLERPLLMIHGITDDNVHFAHTLALIEALYVAGKRAEVVTLSATHMVPDPKLIFAREQLQVDFFREHLAAPVPEIAARLEAEQRAIYEDRRRRFGDKAGAPEDAEVEEDD